MNSERRYGRVTLGEVGPDQGIDFTSDPGRPNRLSIRT